MKMQKKLTYAPGFTLIELLVTITIIALLMSIMIPSIQKSRDTTRTVLCSSRMKQVGILAGAYQADNNGFMLAHQVTRQGHVPSHLSPPALRRDVGFSWTGSLIVSGYVPDNELLPFNSSPVSFAARQPYWEGTLRKNSVFLCPSGRYFAGGTTQTFSSVGSSRSWPAGAERREDRDILDSHLAATIPSPDNARFPNSTSLGYHVTLNSYMVSMHTAWLTPMNFSGWPATSDNLGWAPKKEIRNPPLPSGAEHMAASPSNTVYLVEAHNAEVRVATMDSETPFHVPGQPGHNRRFRIPHQEQANYMAVDGHVGKVERKHFGTLNKTDRPFVWGEYRGQY
jgi:prepilin-type N-terminal cleavage/methylation domain-containing protein/prepilin-type processing-associated H-X9-DG protein